MKPFLKLQSVENIEKMIFGLPLLPGEMTSLTHAQGRRIAKPFYAPHALPGFCRSSMDGYAVRARDVFGATENSPALLQVMGVCNVGSMSGIRLKDGETAQIFTGAPLPAGADAVVMVEHTRKAGESQIEVARSVAPGANIVEADEDASAGQEVIPCGKLLRAQEIGILAAFGIKMIETIRQARVAIISSGDEIRPFDEPLAPGQIRDVNSWSLEALCKTVGALPTRLGIVPDDPQKLVKMLAKAAESFDVVIVSGGSSAGSRDHTAQAFLELRDSRLLAHGAAISPGKPFMLGVAGGICLVGLPGHVSSALVCAHVFVLPLLNHLQGQRTPQPMPWFEATLSRSIASARGRRDYIRCRIEREGEGFRAIPLVSASAVISGLVEADGLVICPENSEGLAKGEKVRVYPV